MHQTVAGFDIGSKHRSGPGIQWKETGKGVLMPLTKVQIASGALQVLIAGILLQTLFFKFTAAEESVYIFTTVGAEPWGRIGSGILELVAAVLLLYPPTAALGALLALGVGTGAVMSHLTLLGIEVKGDGGLLFGLALTVLVSSAVVLFLRRSEIPVVGQYFEIVR